MTFEILDDGRERADNVVNIYNMSLLYLVSRALEVRHKTPLLGMEREWTVEKGDLREKLWGDRGAREVEKWQEFVKESGLRSPVLTREAQVSDGKEKIASAHGSFDNDVDVVAKTIRRVTGKRIDPDKLNLHGF